jgi:glycosyltransferase involved in cell wall biosynthesis
VRAAGRNIVFVTTSYPRFPGDAVGTFMEPIAKGVAARGYRVHLVAPWHPLWNRPASEGDVHFHLFRYAPIPSMNVFGYAAALQADVQLKRSAFAVAPFAMAAGVLATRRVARQTEASIVHAHWVVPGGVIGAAAGRPLVVSLHGSDVFVAERHGMARQAARAVFARASWVTACSEDLRRRAVRLGAPEARTIVVPYGVDHERFKPDERARVDGRASLGIGPSTPMIFAFGRLVAKKGFEYLVDAAALLKRDHPSAVTVLAGEGDLSGPLRERAAAAGLGENLQFLGVVPQQQIPVWLAAADIAVAPSIHDEAGNVDGLPNAVLEIMASGTPLVTTAAGGIGAVAVEGETARVVPERDAQSLARAVGELLARPTEAAAIGRRAREWVSRELSWERVAAQFDAIYERVGRTAATDAAGVSATPSGR